MGKSRDHDHALTHDYLTIIPLLFCTHRYYCLARLSAPTVHWHSEEPDQVRLCFPCVPRLHGMPNPPVMPLALPPPPHSSDVDDSSGRACHDPSAPCAAQDHQDGAGVASKLAPAKQDNSEEEEEEGRVDKRSEQRAYVDLIQKRAGYYEHCNPISDYLQHLLPEHMASFLVKDSDLQKWKSYVFDVVTSDSHSCSCFTKSYGKYVRGTGSVVASKFYDESGRCCPFICFQ